MLTDVVTLDGLLDEHASELASDFEGYRNHAYRVLNLCAAQAPDNVEKIAIAAALHDMGIWTDHTFDYLEPSVRLATHYLIRIDRVGWIDEISAMIRQHHKITPYRARPDWLVEPFRRADWTDVSLGLLKFGASKDFVRTLYARWPSAGFHKRLVQLEARHLGRHPLNPLPVLRL